MKSQYVFGFLIIFFISNSSCLLWATPACEQIFSNTKNLNVFTEAAWKEQFKTDNEPPADKAKYFKAIAWLLKQSIPEIRKELSKINNELGSDIEVAQTLSFLKNVEAYELAYLENIKPINNAVVYGSTNVPLYTLVAQVFLTASFSRNVWVRTPEATREIYLKIFNLFKTYLPNKYTDNIHLVTDPSDLTYDAFNRIFVMGQNRGGTRSIRQPSEIVILTGSPETARTMIDRNLRNLQRLSDSGAEGQQLFLGFLAGVNPAVVVPSAKHQMDVIADKLTFPFLVNGGQDCMNSDVIFVHGDVSAKLQNKLLERFKNLKRTSNTEREHGISPLSMTKNFSKLIEYRNKYEKYLVNKDAVIDVEGKWVAPHLFVIPFSKFADLDIQEHFAPFMTIVTFDNFKQLEQASLDPRIQKKAMYALIYGGDSMSKDLSEARDIFRQGQHGIYTNTHLYAEYLMNSAFGGIGTDSSISTLAKMNGTDPLYVMNRNRPLLISHEVESAFPRNLSISTHTESNAQASKEKDSSWEKIQYPYWTLPALQKIAQEKGLAIVGTVYNKEQAQDFAKLYGIPILDKEKRKNFRGVVLDVTDVGIELNKPFVKGSANPLVGQPSLIKQFGSKYEELRLARAVDPSVMPGVLTFSEVVSGTHLVNFNQARDFLIKKLQLASQDKSIILDPAFENDLYSCIDQFLKTVRQKFPVGAFIKNYGEFASGDAGNSVTTFGSSPQQIAREFILWFNQARKTFKTKKYTDEEFQKFLNDPLFANATRFVNTLLVKPNQLLINERIELAKTLLGSPMEFRVDFFQGQVVGVRIRYGNEFYLVEAQEARDVFNAFMKKAPLAIQTLSGGADVAKTRDGRWVIFEFNFGSSSGTLAPEYYPFEANAIFSSLQRKNTWFMDFALAVAAKSTAEQKDFIRSLENEKPVWWKNKIEYISQVEWARWLIEQRLKNWNASANKSDLAPLLLADIQDLTSDLGTHGNLDFRRLYESAKDFIRRERYSSPR